MHVEDGAVHQVKHDSLTHILMSKVEADRTCHYNSHFQSSLCIFVVLSVCLQGSLKCTAYTDEQLERFICKNLNFPCLIMNSLS